MALGPGPAGLKFWTPQGLTADNTADTGNLPAGIGDQFNPWAPKRFFQDWFLSTSPVLIPAAPFTLTGDAGSYTSAGTAAGLTVNDPVNLPAGMIGGYVPRGRPYPVTLLTRTGGVLVAAEPVILTAAGGNYTITGTPNILAFGQGAAAGAYALTGSSAALALGHVAGSGSYTLTGSNAALALGLGAGAGSYTITGTAAGLVTSGGLAAAAGSYILTGSAAALTVSGTDYMPAGMSGGYVPWRRPFPVNLRTSTGRPLAEVAAPVTLTAAGGSYVITGTAATLTVTGSLTLTAASGSYAITGSSATLALGLTVNAGSYALSGAAAALATGFAAGAGSYAITGSDAQFALVGNITLACGAGSYTLTGSDVSFIGVTPPEVTPPSPGGVGTGVRVGRYRQLKLRKKLKRDECEELLEYLRSLPPAERQEEIEELASRPWIASLLEMMPAAVLMQTPAKPAEDDDDDDACALLLELLLR